MLVQRKQPWSLNRVTELHAAAQLDLPKPDIQIVQMGQNPIWTFAAPGMYVSHADTLDLCSCSQPGLVACRRVLMNYKSISTLSQK